MAAMLSTAEPAVLVMRSVFKLIEAYGEDRRAETGGFEDGVPRTPFSSPPFSALQKVSKLALSNLWR